MRFALPGCLRVVSLTVEKCFPRPQSLRPSALGSPGVSDLCFILPCAQVPVLHGEPFRLLLV